MAATPQYGTMTFRGLRSGKIIPVDFYLSDVAAAYGNWDGGAGAGSSSPDSYTPTEPVILVDFAIVTGTQDTTKIQLLRGNIPTGAFLRYTQHLTTSAYRSPVKLGFPAGIEIRALQYA